MTQPVKVNFKIYQGSTFLEVLRWESSTKVYKPITAVAKSAPCSITVPAHGLPEGWRFKVTDVVGMKEINSADTYHTANVNDYNTISINSLNSISYSTYTSGGVVEYNKPVDLAGYTARMQLREKIGSLDVLVSLTTENGGIVIDNEAKTITLQLSATATAALDFTTAVYSLELVSSGGIVTPFINGTVSLVQEVTR